MTSPGSGRAASELSANLAPCAARISRGVQSAGRPADEVTLIAITKTFPASDMRLLAGLGITDVGENRDQEAAPKAAECAGLGPPLRWHFVGQLQVNKARSVVSYAERGALRRPAEAGPARSARRARAAGRDITCLMQVSLDPSPTRSAAAPAGEQVDTDRRRDRGGGRADARRGDGRGPAGRCRRIPAFGKLGGDRAEACGPQHPGAMMISAGMTGDLEEAIAEGATHVRVGTALLGGRRAFVR